MNEVMRDLAILRERALAAFYAAERRRGLDPLTANEMTHEFSKRFDAQLAAAVEEPNDV